MKILIILLTLSLSLFSKEYDIEELKKGFIEKEESKKENNINFIIEEKPEKNVQNVNNIEEKTIIVDKKTAITSNVIEESQEYQNNKDKCGIFLKYLAEASYQKGYEVGKINSHYEIHSKLKKIEHFLDGIFRIKEYYIEGILEPPLITENREDSISEDGKVYIKKEVTYKIEKDSKFKKPLNWKDFIFNETNIEKPIYEVKYQYFNSNACKKEPESVTKTLNTNFHQGYRDGKDEVILLYTARFDKLNKYMDGLYHYQRLYLTKKINPPVITMAVTPVEKGLNTLTISEEQYYIVKDVEFVDNYKTWENYLIQNNHIRSIPMNDTPPHK